MNSGDTTIKINDGDEVCTRCGKHPVMIVRGGALDGKAGKICATCFMSAIDELIEQLPPDWGDDETKNHSH